MNQRVKVASRYRLRSWVQNVSEDRISNYDKRPNAALLAAGVPTPNSIRINNAGFNAPTCSSMRFRMF